VSVIPRSRIADPATRVRIAEQGIEISAVNRTPRSRNGGQSSRPPGSNRN